MTKPTFRQISSLDVDDAELERLNDRMRVPTMVRPPAVAPSLPQAAEAARPPAVTPSRRQQKLTVRIPTSLADALKLDALQQRTTLRNLVLKALKDAGYKIADAEFLPGAGGTG